MAIESVQQQLERVQAAIKAIEAGSQEYTINGRTVRRANLEDLYKREKELRMELEDQTHGTRTLAGW